MVLILTPRGGTGSVGSPLAPLRLEQGSAVIGRAEDADMVLHHPAVSRRHCTVTGQGAAWQVQDTSTSGTLLNGQRVTGAQALRDGDILTIADVELSIGIAAQGPQVGAAAPRINLDDWGRAPTPAPQAAPAPVAAFAGTQPPAGAGAGRGQDIAIDQLLAACGLTRSAVPGADAQIAAAAGALLRASLAALAALAQDRRKARKDLGLAEEPAQDNVLLAGPTPEAALARLLALPPDRAAVAVGRVQGELDAHQRATLGAMQGALRATLDQFAPDAIKLRAESDAAAWKAYDRAFRAQDGFVAHFAEALAKAYEKLSRV